jgi:HD-like signal output (HDOD) protein
MPGNLTPKMLVQNVAGLVSLPDVCIRVCEMVDDPNCCALDIGRVISQDTSLTARLLRIVNSAFYRFPQKIETVSRAIAIVGNRDLRDLVLAAKISGIFEKMSTDLINMDQFWRHGIYTGVLSRLIAARCDVLHRERLFIAGLMHDIGRLIVSYKIPDLVREAMMQSIDQNIPMYRAEQNVMGFDHAQVAAELMKSWGFPESHQVAALYHHEPDLSHASTLECSIVHMADILSHLAETGTSDGSAFKEISKEVWSLTRMRPEMIETYLVQSREQFIEILSLFRPKSRRQTDYAA